MKRVTCTCKPSELFACAYCRCERLRLERLYREVESYAAMKATVGVFVTKRPGAARDVISETRRAA